MWKTCGAEFTSFYRLFHWILFCAAIVVVHAVVHWRSQQRALGGAFDTVILFFTLTGYRGVVL